MDKFTQVTQYIDKVAQAVSAKFNVAASEVYKTLILQTRVDLYTDIFCIILFIIAIIVSVNIFKRLFKGYTNKDSFWYDEDAVFWINTILVISIVICIVFVILTVLEMIQIAVNPNYFIIKYYIMPLIK